MILCIALLMIETLFFVFVFIFRQSLKWSFTLIHLKCLLAFTQVTHCECSGSVSNGAVLMPVLTLPHIGLSKRWLTVELGHSPGSCQYIIKKTDRDTLYFIAEGTTMLLEGAALQNGS